MAMTMANPTDCCRPAVAAAPRDRPSSPRRRRPSKAAPRRPSKRTTCPTEESGHPRSSLSSPPSATPSDWETSGDFLICVIFHCYYIFPFGSPLTLFSFFFFLSGYKNGGGKSLFIHFVYILGRRRRRRLVYCLGSEGARRE